MRNVGLIDLGKAGGGNPSLWPHVAMHHPNTHETERRRRGASPTTGSDEAHRTSKPKKFSNKQTNKQIKKTTPSGYI